MIVSVNPEPQKQAFESLLNDSLLTLHRRATEKPEKYVKLLGNKLEDEVLDVLTENSLHTPFENSIKLISGQRFPDIVANDFYGIEVKTTKENHWRSTGSSVAEGTRVDSVERIYMLFGKMCDPIQFRCRPYEECLSDVVVTHSPRYLINMELGQGETFFDKIHVPYDELRKQDNPIKTVVKFYKSQLQQGERLWWMGDDDDEQEKQASNIILRLWNYLKEEEKENLKLQAYCLFPEMFGYHGDKFNRLAMWLAMEKGVVCPNVRDQFTAGGKSDIIINDQRLYNVPQIFLRLYMNLNNIKEMLCQFNADKLAESWNCAVNQNNKIEVWKEQLIENNNSQELKIILNEI